MTTVPRICSVGDCSGVAHAQGLCGTHYARRTRGVRLRLDDPIQVKNPSRRCLVPDCERPFSTNNLCGMHYQRKRNYSLTVEEMVNLYGQPCGICQEPPRATGRAHHVDHDHSCCPEPARSCGKCIRGVLCSACNTAIGSLKEDPELFRRALSYLSGHLIN